MNILKTWQDKHYGLDYRIELTDLAVIIHTDIINGKFRTHKFEEFLTKTYPMLSPKIEFELLKEICKISRHSDFKVENSIYYDFWKAIDNSHFQEERIFTDKDNFLFRDKYCFAKGYKRYNGEEQISNHSSFADFFFFGPDMPDISLPERTRLRREIFDSLTEFRHGLSLNHAFTLFDYDKIEPVDLRHEEGISGNYFKIEDGKVTVGGWDNPRNGGEYYVSVERLWHKHSQIIPAVFNDSTPEILEMLKKAIVTGDEGTYLSPKSESGRDSESQKPTVG